MYIVTMSNGKKYNFFIGDVKMTNDELIQYVTTTKYIKLITGELLNTQQIVCIEKVS